MFGSLQNRLAIFIGSGITLLWLLAAGTTTYLLRHEMDEVFDSALQETAQRVLQLAVIDILNRDEAGVAQYVAMLREHEEYFTYIVRDDQGRILLASHAADLADFPPFAQVGFTDTATHRIYYDAAVQDTITIAVAEPNTHRNGIAWDTMMVLSLPLLLFVPLSYVLIGWLVRRNLRPLRDLGAALGARSAHDLTDVVIDPVADELRPITAAANELLGRLSQAFESERSFAANAAHELRTPVAGAIAQAQRLRSESADPNVQARTTEIEGTLKRLNRLSEKLMQLARAEGGRVRTDQEVDLRPLLHFVVQDLTASYPNAQIEINAPNGAVLSTMDADAFAIVMRNLIENSIRHGDGAVSVSISPDRSICVQNDCAPVPQEVLDRLGQRYERHGPSAGSGLGLSIVRTIVQKAGGTLTFASPIANTDRGFVAMLKV